VVVQHRSATEHLVTEHVVSEWVATESGRRRWPLADATAGLVVIAVFWVQPLVSAGSWPRTVIGGVLALATAAAMVLRHRFSATATVVAAAATVAATVLGVCQDPMLATAWCLYPLAIERAGRTRDFVVALACMFAVLVAVTGVDSSTSGLPGSRVVLAVAALTAAWLLGTAVGRQLESAREAERARVQLDVARDVHDVVGHALGVISAQASVTRGLPDADERELRGTLGDIEGHARQALQEMQTLVRGLRDAGSAPSTSGAVRGVPGTAELSSMIDNARAAGLTIDAHIDLQPDLRDGTRVVVFRIVQEALNNVIRHAPGARCSVRVGRAADEIVVGVRDHGSPTPGGGAGSGLGLQGMRERAVLAGGTVSWRRPPSGGFEVNARLPVRNER